MTPNQLPTLFRRVSLITISAFLLFTLAKPLLSQAAYQEPTTNPPFYDTDQIPEVINIGGTDTSFQQKLGSLLIGPRDSATCDLSNPAGNRSGCAQLCLNPDFNLPGTSDTQQCISSWSDLASRNNGFLRRFDGTSPFLGIFPPANNINKSPATTPDAGYVGWRAQPSDIANSQLFTLLAEVPTGTPIIRPPYDPAAIRAEGDSSAFYAAEFLGTLGVVGVGSGAPRLCLNFNIDGSPSCISSWADVVAQGNPFIVKLQDLHTATFSVDQGQTATGGTLVANALVAGSPDTTAPVNINYSCGDNICQPPIENSVSCSPDCQ